jgi:hypothetical protein
MFHFFHIFKKADELLSKPGGLKYTKRQLFYEVCRLVEPKWRAPVGRLLPISLAPTLGYADFDHLLGSFFAAGANLPNLLVEGISSFVSDESVEPDLFDYGLPRLIVCRNDATAAMLTANWVHLELSCLILPKSLVQPLPDAVCAILARDEAPTIYLLLGASEEDYEFHRSFASRAALPKKWLIRRIGLTPRQVPQRRQYSLRPVGSWLSLRLSRLLNRKRPQSESNLSNREREWLKDGYYTEPEQLTPAQIIRLIRKAIQS